MLIWVLLGFLVKLAPSGITGSEYTATSEGEAGDTCAFIPIGANTAFQNDVDGAQTFTLEVVIDEHDHLTGVTFLNARLNTMDIELGPTEYIQTGDESWSCWSDGQPPWVLASGQYVNCGLLDFAGCISYRTHTFEWNELMEGLMFWFLLSEAGGDSYSLETRVMVSYLDSQDGDIEKSVNGTWSALFSSTHLEEAFGIVLPTMEVRVTSYEIGQVTGGIAVLDMVMELYLSNETMWDFWNNDGDNAMTLSSSDAALNAEYATINYDGGRTWTVSLDVQVCDLAGAADLVVTKPIWDYAIKYPISSTLSIDMMAACPSTNSIGDLPTGTATNVYSDASQTTAASSFYLGDTVYACTTLSPYAGSLASVELATLMLTQSTTNIDLTSAVTTSTPTGIPGGAGKRICISFVLPESLSASLGGISTTATATYSLTYATSRRRLSSREHNVPFVFSVRDSGCYFEDGSVAMPGDVKRVPCAYFGMEVQRCQNYQWETIEDTCSLFYITTKQPLLQAGFACSVLLIFISYFSYLVQASKLTKIGKD